MRSAASARVARHRSRAQRETRQAGAYGQPWTVPDDYQLRYGPGSLAARAGRLGRTYEGARARLAELRALDDERAP